LAGLRRTLRRIGLRLPRRVAACPRVIYRRRADAHRESRDTFGHHYVSASIRLPCEATIMVVKKVLVPEVRKKK
jgi:hypothetical protein